MKNHGKFTEELIAYLKMRHPALGDSFNVRTANEIMKLSRMGLAPEGKGSPGANRMADLVYAMPESFFAHESAGTTIETVTSVPLVVVPIPPVPAEPSTTVAATLYKLSQTSLDKLKPVHRNLAECVKLAIKYSLVDFGVNQGARTIEEQRTAFAAGTTRTMNSKHLPDKNGVVRAVDLVAWVGGKISWEFDYYYYIARAMDRAATVLGIANHIRWGCVWDRVLSDFGLAADKSIAEGAGIATKEAIRREYLKAIDEYKKRHAGSDFLDGPHFEWVD